MKITRNQIRKIIFEAAGPNEKQDLKDAVFAYMKSSVSQSVPDDEGKVTDDHVDAALDSLSSDSKIAAEEYVDADPDNLGISGLGETYVRFSEAQLRKIIREEIEKSVPFGSGMEQADLDPEQEELIGHT